jgi:hypothetical protein
MTQLVLLILIYLLEKNGAGADVQIGHESLNKETVNMLKNTLNLEAGDAIKNASGKQQMKITGVC